MKLLIFRTVVFSAICMIALQVHAQESADSSIITLSSEAQEAVDNGVRLEFSARYATVSKMLFISFHRLTHQHRFVMQRHALSNRYVVRKDDLETPRIFRSVSEAMGYISAQAQLQLEFYDNDEHSMHMRVSLNKYSLPGPMRLKAFISDAWELDTGWVSRQVPS